MCEEHTTTLRKAFREVDFDAITLHWDGKLFLGVRNKNLVDRIQIIVNFKGMEQLLEILVLLSGNERDEGQAVHQMLRVDRQN